MPLTRREFAQTLLATTAVAALVPVSIPIEEAPWRHEWYYLSDPDQWFLIEPTGRYVFGAPVRLGIADWRLVYGAQVS